MLASDCITPNLKYKSSNSCSGISPFPLFAFPVSLAEITLTALASASGSVSKGIVPFAAIKLGPLKKFRR